MPRPAVLILTPDILRACYDLLDCCPPFDKWNLPDGDDIEFRIIKDKACYGWYLFEDGKHVIAVSEAKCGYLTTVMATMAHEMVHLFQRHSCMESPSSIHNAAFRRLAAQVCRALSFDPKAF
jgi:hypothetical protein